MESKNPIGTSLLNRLNGLGKNRFWLAQQLEVSKSLVTQVMNAHDQVKATKWVYKYRVKLCKALECQILFTERGCQFANQSKNLLEYPPILQALGEQAKPTKEMANILLGIQKVIGVSLSLETCRALLADFGRRLC